jgi:hypothetical protein
LRQAEVFESIFMLHSEALIRVYKSAYIGFSEIFGGLLRGNGVLCRGAEVREMTNNCKPPFECVLARFPSFAFLRFLFIFLSIASQSAPSIFIRHTMSTGSTQAQPIIAFLQEQRVVPDLLPAVPETLEGELVVQYPTHSVTYVPPISNKKGVSLMMMTGIGRGNTWRGV